MHDDDTNTDAGATNMDTSDSVTPNATTVASASNGGSQQAAANGAVCLTDYTQMVDIPANINGGVTSPSNQIMINALGTPGNLTADCSSITNTALQAQIVTQNVGPFSVTGLSPAVQALTRIFTAVQNDLPDLYQMLGTAGMLCVRQVRNSNPPHFSNHSWGTAIDMSINGVMTPLGSTQVQEGLVSIAPYFNNERFFWGAGYSGRKDGMHFEAASELIAQWKSDGTIP